MRNLFLILLIYFFTSNLLAQQENDSIKRKTNPIFFGSINASYSGGSIKGLTGGLSLNYQTNTNLFTFRYKENYKIEDVELFIFFPIVLESRTFEEYSILYGKRYIKNDFAYYFSAGISFNTFRRSDKDNVTKFYRDSFGFPLEIGYQWFNAKKEIYRILGIIPVGKPTAFGRSLGLNLYANIGKESYFGFELAIGLGWHKKY